MAAGLAPFTQFFQRRCVSEAAIFRQRAARGEGTAGFCVDLGALLHRYFANVFAATATAIDTGYGFKQQRSIGMAGRIE